MITLFLVHNYTFSHDKPTSFSYVHALSLVFSRSYHGAQIFEIYGLGEEVVDTAFRGSTSRIGGLTMNEVRISDQCFFVLIIKLGSVVC